MTALHTPQVDRKRELLQLLTRDELLAALDAYELTVRDRRVKSELVAALEASEAVTVEGLLEGMKRARLKELCRALGLDDSGKAITDIVARLAGEPPKKAVQQSFEDALARAGAKPEKRGRRAKAKEAAPALSAEAIAEEARAAQREGKLTRELLERHLWAAADILRGSIDSADYKHFIFGLLFLKRLSDRFDEECEAILAEGRDPDDRDEHPFFVPPEARWSHIQKAATGLGEVLNKAAAKLEDENPSLEGVLAGVDFNDATKLGDAKQRDVTLQQLVQHFAKIDLKNRALAEPDMLGRAYEYLIERFADDAGKKGGEFYTPHKVVRLLVEILEPKEGMRICDPTCGSGGMLIQCAQYIAEQGGNPRNVSLYGQEKNLGTWAICKMNMLLHGRLDDRIEKGDTIRDPKLVEDGALMTFDRVIANPPFSLDNWGQEAAQSDPHGRFRFGIPPKSVGDLAFVQHMVATLAPEGRAAVVMPHGVLFRGGSEGKIRQGLLEEDLIEAVIGLPQKLFYGTGIPAAVLVLNRKKPVTRRGKVIFVEASREYGVGNNQNVLRDEDVKRIASTVRAFADVERYARVVPLEEIERNDFNLNISRYVETAEAAEKVDLAEAIRKLREAERARDEAKAVMDKYLAEVGYGDA